MDTKTSNPTRSILMTVIIILVVLVAGLLIRATTNNAENDNEGASLVDSLVSPNNSNILPTIDGSDSNGKVEDGSVITQNSNIGIVKPSGLDSWTVGGTFSVSWVGGVGKTYVALVPTLPNGFTAVSAKEASAVGSWKVFENVRTLDITVPATPAGNYNIVVYNEFDAVVSDSFSITQ